MPEGDRTAWRSRSGADTNCISARTYHKIYLFQSIIDILNIKIFTSWQCKNLYKYKTCFIKISQFLFDSQFAENKEKPSLQGQTKISVRYLKIVLSIQIILNIIWGEKVNFNLCHLRSRVVAEDHWSFDLDQKDHFSWYDFSWYPDHWRSDHHLFDVIQGKKDHFKWWYDPEQKI